MPKTPLYQSGSATADANGTATVMLGPLRAFEIWEITGSSVTNSSTTADPKCIVYRNHVAPSNIVGSTYSGRQDSGPANERLMSGEKLIAQWTGADVGSACQFNVSGESVTR